MDNVEDLVNLYCSLTKKQPQAGVTFKAIDTYISLPIKDGV